MSHDFHVEKSSLFSERMKVLLLQQKHYYSFLTAPRSRPKGGFMSTKCALFEFSPATSIATLARVDCDRPTMELEQYRDRLSQWLFSVVDYYALDRDLVAVILNVLDRFYHDHRSVSLSRSVSEFHDANLSRQEHQKRSEIHSSIQLATLTSLYIVVKAYSKEKLGFDTLLSLAKNIFTKNQVLHMEIVLMNAVQWRISVPTPKVFIHHFLMLLRYVISSHLDMDKDEAQLHMICLMPDIQSKMYFLGELSACHSYFHDEGFLPSTIAAASLLFGMRLCKVPRPLIHQTQLVLFQHVGLNSSEEKDVLFRCMSGLCAIYSCGDYDEEEPEDDGWYISSSRREPSPTHAQDFPQEDLNDDES